jgi:hypothetical protein
MLHRAYVPEQIRARFARIGRITGHPEPTPKTEGAYATWGEKTSKVRIADNPPGTTR